MTRQIAARTMPPELQRELMHNRETGSSYSCIVLMLVSALFVGCNQRAAAPDVPPSEKDRDRSVMNDSVGSASKADTQDESQLPSTALPGETQNGAHADASGRSSIEASAGSSDATATISATGNATAGDAADELVVASFDELNIGMQADMVFRPFLLRNRPAEQLIGKRVHLGGYIYPGASSKGMTEFILLKNTECKFGPGGVADHLINIKMQGNATADYTNKVVYVEGRLQLNPIQGPDGNTWSIYDIHCENVTLRPRR